MQWAISTQKTQGTISEGEISMKTRALVIATAFVAGLFAYPHLTAQGGRRVIRPERAPQTGLPYSPAILTGGTLYLAGQLGRDQKTEQLAAGGIEAETR